MDHVCCRFELEEWLGGSMCVVGLSWRSGYVDHVCYRFELEEWLGGSCVL